MEVKFYLLLAKTLDRGEGSASRPVRFTQRKTASCRHWLGESVGSRASQEPLKKTELSCPRRESTIVSSIMYIVLTNIHLKCVVTYRNRPCVSKVIYAAATMIEVRGYQAFMCFSVLCCPLEFWFRGSVSEFWQQAKLQTLPDIIVTQLSVS
jgi:hypothetical protein